MNRWTRPRYFAAVKIDPPCSWLHPSHVDIIAARTEPTVESHGDHYSYTFGPYRTQAEAAQVAAYQGHPVDKYIREG